MQHRHIEICFVSFVTGMWLDCLFYCFFLFFLFIDNIIIHYIFWKKETFFTI